MNESYAQATVVRRRAPVSAHLGDRAVIHADGRMEGFIGGSCSREIVRTQALESLRTGEARLVRIRPDAQQTIEEPGEITVPMRCASEGAIDVYVEPHLARAQILVAGFTPVADALARIGPALDFDVVRFVDERELTDAGAVDASVFPLDALSAHAEAMEPNLRARSAAVAASQGHYDEIALAQFLRYGFGYTGLLASRKRAATVLGVLEQEGTGAEPLASIHNPAGFDIGAHKPGEVAVSILAEIVQHFHRHPAAAPEAASSHGREQRTAIDPVCGMGVNIETAAHTAVFEGRTYFFCCPHCRASFVKNPEQYLAASAP